MATSPEVKVKISGDPRGFDAAVKSVQGSLKRLSGDLSVIQQLSAKAFAFAGLSGAASFAGLLTLAKNAADVADEMGKMAQGAGVAVEEFSRLAYAANLAGASQEDLASGLRRLADDAASGGKNLAEVGIRATDSAGRLKSSEQIFGEVADLFQSLPDGVTKTSAAITLFGRNLGGTLIPLLNAGSSGLKQLADESDRFGKTVTQDAFARAEEFNDNLTRLQSLAQGAGQEIGNALIPALNDLSLAFLESLTQGDKLAKDQALKEWADEAARAVAFVVDAFDGLARVVRIAGRVVGAEAAALVQVFRGDLQASARIQKELLSDIQGILDEGLFSDRLRNVQSAEVRVGQERVDNEQRVARRKEAIAKELFQAELRLNQQRKKVREDAAAEELKGAERLRDALRTAWQASIDGARQARQEAAGLLQQAGDARTAGADRAAERRNRNLTPQQASLQAQAQAERLRAEAGFAASTAVIAAFQGQAAKANKLAEESTKLAERAEAFVNQISDDNIAANLFEQLGKIREDALKAQARVKEAEAKNLEDVAKKQDEEIAKAEARIKALKAEIEKPVQLKADVQAAESEVQRLKALLDELRDKTVTVTVNTVAAGAPGASEAPAPAAAPGFAWGGYTGPGGKFQPAGIVHAGEFVLRSEVVRQRGMRQMLERLNRFGADARGYAEGGLVKPAGGASLQPINLHWPDGTVTPMQARPDVAREVQRVFDRAALKRGGRRS